MRKNISADDIIPREDFIREALRRNRAAQAQRRGSYSAPPWRDTLAQFSARVKALNLRGLTLKPHQISGALKFLNHRGFLCADEPGLGKTAEALMALSDVSKVGVIVVCPSKLVGNWGAEIALWRPEFRVRVNQGKAIAWPDAGEVVLVGWGSVPAVTTRPNCRTQIIYDEIHYGKGLESKRGQAAWRLGKECETRWGLSGTPCDNDPTDFFAIMSILGSSCWLAPNPDAFEVWVNRSQYGKAIGVDKRIKEIADKLYIRRLASEVLDLPKMTNVIIDVVIDFESSVSEAVDLLAAELIKDIAKPKFQKTLNLSDKAFAAAIAEKPKSYIVGRKTIPPRLAKIVETYRDKLHETKTILAKGHRAFDSRDPKKTVLAQQATSLCKLPRALQWISDHPDEPIIVFSCFVAPIKALEAIPGFEIITGTTSLRKKDKIVKDFQSGKIKKLGVTRSAQDGITLVTGCKMLCIDKWWVSSTNDQIVRRIHRIGQTRDVEITYLRGVESKPEQSTLFEIDNTHSTKTGTIDGAVEKAIRRKRKIRTLMGIRG